MHVLHTWNQVLCPLAGILSDSSVCEERPSAKSTLDFAEKIFSCNFEHWFYSESRCWWCGLIRSHKEFTIPSVRVHDVTNAVSIFPTWFQLLTSIFRNKPFWRHSWCGCHEAAANSCCPSLLWGLFTKNMWNCVKMSGSRVSCVRLEGQLWQSISAKWMQQ